MNVLGMVHCKAIKEITLSAETGVCVPSQRRQSLTKGSGKWNRFGPSSEFTTRRHVTSLISSIKEKPSAEVRNAEAVPWAGSKMSSGVGGKG